MSYTPPFVPESRKDDKTAQERVFRARKAREDAAARIERAYAELEPDTREWQTETPVDIPAEPLRVL